MMKKVVLAAILCCVLLFGIAAVSVGASTVIDTVTVSGLDHPTRNNGLDTTVTLGGKGYSLHSVEWYDKTAGSYQSANDFGKVGHVYEAVIWVEADDGYVFKSVDDRTHDLKCSVNGFTVSAIKAYEYKSWAMVELRLTFPEVPNVGWVSSVDLHPDVPQLSYPLDYFEISRPEYMGVTKSGLEGCTRSGSSWWIGQTPVQLGNNYYQKGTAYRYYATLVPKPGYSFSMNPTVTVNGEGVSYVYENDPTHGKIMCVSYQFPALPDVQSITAVNIEIASPVANGSPVYDIISKDGYKSVNPAVNTAGYYNGIRWSDPAGGSVGTFAEGFSYTVSVSLKADSGYKFVQGIVPTVNGKTATMYSVSSTGDTITLSYVFDPIPASHTHVPSGWGNDVYTHVKVCTVCGVPMEEDEHRGGTATCNSQAKCDVCGFFYGEFGTTHKTNELWTAKGAEGHGHLCTVCNTVIGVQAHVAGKEATESEPQKCTVCGYVIKPALNHTHSLSRVEKVEPTCTASGRVEHYACSGCNVCFADAEGKTAIAEADLPIPPAGHIAGEEWLTDEHGHTKACTVCEIRLDEIKEPHNIENNVCTVCGYKAAAETKAETKAPEVEATVPEDEVGDPSDKDGKGEGFAEGYILPATIAIAFTGGGAAACIVYVWKKKK